MTDNWQERAEAAEDGLFQVVKALGFDTDGAPSADGFFGPMTYWTPAGARYTTPADIAVAYATDYRAEMEEEADALEADHVRILTAIEQAEDHVTRHYLDLRIGQEVLDILARALKENT